MRDKNLYKYKCLVYARVSTKNEDQAESCENQIKLCDEYVDKHGNLVIVGRYIDDGISGKGDNSRPRFMAMLERLEEGDIRYILVKDSNRLCRSTEISGSLTSIFRRLNVKVIYVGSNTIYDATDRSQVMMNTFKAMMGEDYVYQQSENAIIAHHQKCMEKRLDATDVRYGYRWDRDKKCMVINEEEADIVRKMFEWYVYGGIGVSDISKRLADMKVFGPRGNIIPAKTISKRLTDEAYIGTFYINKKGSMLSVGKNAKTKRFDRPKEEWVAVNGPAIIPKELFDLAQELHKERIHVYVEDKNGVYQGRFKGTHIFSGKVFCGDCGTQFHHEYADRNKTIGVYKDYFSRKLKKPDERCNNTEYNRIYEETLIHVTKYAINVFLKDNEKCIDNLLNIIKEATLKSENDTTEKVRFENRIKKLDKEISKNLIAWRDAPDADMKQMFYEMYQKNKKEKDELQVKLQEISDASNDYMSLEEEMRKIKQALDELKQVDEIDRSVVENFIEKIIIGVNGDVHVILKFNASYVAKLKKRVASTYASYLDSSYINLKYIVGYDSLKNEILYLNDGKKVQQGMTEV